MTANKARLGIDIINLSLGHPIYEPAASDPLVQAVEAAVRAGIVVVVAAGNYGTSPSTGLPGYAGVLSPGNAPSAITVGAVNTFATNVRSDDRVTAYSSRGPTWYDGTAKPDIVAPGHRLASVAATESTLYVNHPEVTEGAYLRLSGTSMAAGVVTGAVALVLEANRNAFLTQTALTPNAVKAIVQYTAIRVRDDLGVEYDDLTQGAGAINAAGAVDLASRIDASYADLVMVADEWLHSVDIHCRSESAVGGEDRVG